MAHTIWQTHRPYGSSDDIYSSVRVGAKCRVGSEAPEAGRYKHSACSNTAFFNKGNSLTACRNRTCRNPSAEWILQEKQIY